MPDDEDYYIAHYMDHWSKFHIIWPLMKKSAIEVSMGLVTKVFPYIGVPKILQSDNGREFVNEIVKEVILAWPGQVTIINGRPRHSQSQGLVEKGNHLNYNQKGLSGKDREMFLGQIGYHEFNVSNCSEKQ